MYIDISPNDNVAEPVMATFKETGPSRTLCAIKLWRDETWRWCAVTGWDEHAPVPAWVTPIEESGDGPALLVHGGNHGLRLQVIVDHQAADQVDWRLEDAAQWGEPFLICRPDTELRKLNVVTERTPVGNRTGLRFDKPD